MKRIKRDHPSINYKRRYYEYLNSDTPVAILPISVICFALIFGGIVDRKPIVTLVGIVLAIVSYAILIGWCIRYYRLWKKMPKPKHKVRR